MKMLGEVKSVIKENAMVARSPYGKGFWILGCALTLAASIVFHMETSRARPVVERIPASEATAYLK